MNGITGGNQGPGERSVIPGSATARLSFRLVEGQDPGIRELFQAWVRSRLPDGCTAEFEGFPGSSAVAMPEDNPFVKATARGLAEEWGKPTVLGFWRLHSACAAVSRYAGHRLYRDRFHPARRCYPCAGRAL